MSVQHFVRKCNRKFLAEARQQEAQLRLIRLPDRVAKLVRMRLELTSDFIGEAMPPGFGGSYVLLGPALEARDHAP